MKNTDNYRHAQCCKYCENYKIGRHEMMCKLDQEYIEETSVCDSWAPSKWSRHDDFIAGFWLGNLGNGAEGSRLRLKFRPFLHSGPRDLGCCLPRLAPAPWDAIVDFYRGHRHAEKQSLWLTNICRVKNKCTKKSIYFKILGSTYSFQLERQLNPCSV
jgi:hypothetical protein